MRNHWIGLLLLTILVFVCMPAALCDDIPFALQGEVICDGVVYEITADKAIIVDFAKDTSETVIPYTLDGKPVSMELRNYFPRPSLKKLVIGEGYVTLGEIKFWGFDIEELVLPNSLQEIGSYSFEGVKGLRILTTPKGLRTIEDGAFTESDIEQVILSETVLSVSNTAFLECDALLAYIVHEDNPVYTTIDGALYSKDGRILYDYPNAKGDTWTVPEGTMEIVENALLKSKLVSLRIGEGMEVLGKEALPPFYYSNYDISEIYLPASLRVIEEKAFGHHFITKIEVAEGNPNFYCDGYALYQRDTQTLVRFYNEYALQYTVQSGTKHIAAEAFTRKELLQSVVLPCGVISIGDYAFYECTALQQVQLPITLETIGERAFYNCATLERLTLPPNLNSIGKQAFESCRSLLRLHLPDSLMFIGEYAFSNCRDLTLYANEGTYGAEYIRAHPDRKDYKFDIGF